MNVKNAIIHAIAWMTSTPIFTAFVLVILVSVMILKILERNVCHVNSRIIQEKLSDQNTRLTSAESTWQMAENLYRQLADEVREHSYDIKDLNR